MQNLPITNDQHWLESGMQDNVKIIILKELNRNQASSLSQTKARKMDWTPLTDSKAVCPKELG